MTKSLRERVRDLTDAWREDWDGTRSATRVVLGIVAVVAVAWIAFAIWFALAWQF